MKSSMTNSVRAGPGVGFSGSIAVPSRHQERVPPGAMEVASPSTTPQLVQPHPKLGVERSWRESNPNQRLVQGTVSPVGPRDKLGVSRALNTIKGTPSLEATHLLSQPSSTPIPRQHGGPTRLILQNQKGYQTPVWKEQTQSGQARTCGT